MDTKWNLSMMHNLVAMSFIYYLFLNEMFACDGKQR
jgi:hypothetical protein